MSLAETRFHLRQAIGKFRRKLLPVRHPLDAEVRLHLGCGEINYPGFINIDGIDRPHVHYVQRIDRLQQFDDSSVDLVYTSHTLEHFPRSRLNNVLNEWRRVLRPGGCLRISVPDFDLIVGMYQATGRDIEEILPPLFGGQDYPFNFHYTAFTARSLERRLKEVGFPVVARWHYGSGEFQSLPDWSGRSIMVGGRAFPISLNVEATK